MLPLILGAIPALIKLAEMVIPSKSSSDTSAVLVSNGSVKKDFVLKALEILYDKQITRIMHDFPGVDEKRLFLRLADVAIDELVPSLTR